MAFIDRLSLVPLIATIVLFVFVPFESEAGQAKGGLWCSYGDDSSVSATVKHIEIENINYLNLDARLIDVLGQANDANINCKGYVHADEAGEYDFLLDVMSEKFNFQVNSIRAFKTSDYGEGDRAYYDMYLEEGWYSIRMDIQVPDTATDAQAQLYWRPPSNPQNSSGWEIIPEEKLGYYYWSDDGITIPSSGTAQKVDFVAAAAGGHNKPTMKLEIDLPSDLLADDVWVVWYRDGTDPLDIDVTNETTGETRRVMGISGQHKIYDRIAYYQSYGNLPASLIVPDGSGRLNLRFDKVVIPTDLDAGFQYGLAIIIPFEDPSLPSEGFLSFKLHSFDAYHTISPVAIFPVEGGDEVKPLFILEDGDTRRLLNDPTITDPDRIYRPNYLTMVTGSGDPPAIDEILRDDYGADYVVPESFPIDENDPDTFYPTYGRDGEKIDVVSPNWVPNDWPDVYNQYVDQSGEGLIDPITIPAGHEWIAFQYAGTNFPQDGVDGNGESGGWAGGGIFMRELPKFDLDVTVIGSGTVASNPAGINCGGDCSEEYDENEVVTLTATPAAGGSFISWENGCTGSNPECILVMDRDTNVTARFFTPLPVCGSADNQGHCTKPSTNLCAPPSTVSAAGVNLTDDWWEWSCELGASSTICTAQRNCEWVEK